MHSVEQIAREIVAREGGYVNDPADPGGATKYGVTIHTMRALWLDLDGDGRITARDVQALTRAQAEDIFVRHYFRAPRLDLLPEALQPAVFDMYVNGGSNAVKILQRLLNRLLPVDLIEDGRMGPLTARAAHLAAADLGAQVLVDQYGAARRDYYYRIGDLRPASRKYARRRDGGKGGWITRAEEFMTPAARLTDAQHRTRVAKWG
ncbi:holin-associated N-acetylmuramidase [Paracoccus sp. p3-h83]|uniref:holin-associated N-acetylmuramidase n=1 Tax=Paracoccus sp. p3-h83 TaxID=3342805 RepID=UPI0035BB9603